MDVAFAETFFNLPFALGLFFVGQAIILLVRWFRAWFEFNLVVDATTTTLLNPHSSHKETSGPGMHQGNLKKW